MDLNLKDLAAMDWETLQKTIYGTGYQSIID